MPPTRADNATGAHSLPHCCVIAALAGYRRPGPGWLALSARGEAGTRRPGLHQLLAGGEAGYWVHREHMRT